MDPLAALGAMPTGERLARIQRSPHFRDGAFQNPVETRMMTASTTAMLRRQFGGSEQRVPRGTIPIVSRTRESFAEPPASGLRVTWLGHSTMFIEIDGYRVLVDPVFGKRASPSQLVGPKRFHPPPLPLDEMPALDAIIITHDHYDHLDADVVHTFARSRAHDRVQWITTLGVGAHLERWGVPTARITELDWSDTAHVGSLRMTALPARHFSGRTMTRDQTLWASWVIAGPAHRVFHTGDTGYFEGLRDIGVQFGPFDLSMIKIGAYDAMWPDIHLTPEDAVRLHALVSGGLLLPIHWGTFNLAFHAWNEPPERLLKALAGEEVRVTIPRPGQAVEPSAPPDLDPWWRRV